MKLVENGNDCVEISRSIKKLQVKSLLLAMDDDFNTAQGLGAIFELVKELNKAVDSEKLMYRERKSYKSS